LTGLVKKMDEKVDAVAGKWPRGLGVFVIVDNRADGMDKKLKDFATKEKLKRVSFGIDTPPKNYEVSGAADVTVVIYKLGQRRREPVTANFALRKHELDKAKTEAIVKALADQLPK
jgi:hypothetical protein